MKDIVFLVADGNMEKLFEGLLPRIPISSGTTDFNYDILVNPTHDAGNLNDSYEYLRPFIKQYKYAIVVFDREGCGEERTEAVKLERKVENSLDENGWKSRNTVLVIDPELENWIWVASPLIKEIINWKFDEEIILWTKKQNYTFNSSEKPERPKESFEAVLRYAKTPRSSAIYKKIASRVSYRKCNDRAFVKLIHTLSDWFKKSDI